MGRGVMLITPSAYVTKKLLDWPVVKAWLLGVRATV
jgi:hypothetical protein